MAPPNITTWSSSVFVKEKLQLGGGLLPFIIGEHHNPENHSEVDNNNCYKLFGRISLVITLTTHQIELFELFLINTYLKRGLKHVYN